MLLGDLRRLFVVYRSGPGFYRPPGRAPRAAVIMGAQVLRGGRPSRTLEARARHAARLHAKNNVDLLIPTGGLGEHPPPEAHLMQEILRREGVPEASVLLEDEAVNTWESAVRVAKLARDRGIEAVWVVSDPLHCVRTEWAFREAGLPAYAEPVYGSPMWRKPWSRRGQLVREAGALIWYRIRYRAGSRSRP
jgi:uncharacterized SAM-binding protein YcdF (DUF218 family)